MFAHVIQRRLGLRKGRSVLRVIAPQPASSPMGNPSTPTECLTNQFPLIYAIC